MPQLLSLNVKIVLLGGNTKTAMHCWINLVRFTEYSLESFSCFLGPTDLYPDTATIDNLTGLLIVRLEVVGCCEVGSVGMVCVSVWQFGVWPQVNDLVSDSSLTNL